MIPSLASLLIVHYNGADQLRRCLSSLATQSLPRYRFEVIVLDNASPDGSGQIVAKEFPGCRFVFSERNLGFAEGNNVAKQYARGEWLVLLNNDTVADPHWLEELLQEAETTSSDRIASKLVMEPDGTLINSGGVVLLRSGWAADDGFRTADDGRFEQSRDVFAGCGAALLVRNQSGPIFPKKYFAYYEDVDSAWRDRSQGGTTRYAARAVVKHSVGASAGERSPLFTFLTDRNRLLTTVKNADPFLAGWAVVKAAANAMRGVLRLPDRHAVARIKAMASFVVQLPITMIQRYDARSCRVRAGSVNDGVGGPSVAYASGSSSIFRIDRALAVRGTR
jgi:GT2 family glycosyltransferase